MTDRIVITELWHKNKTSLNNNKSFLRHQYKAVSKLIVVNLDITLSCCFTWYQQRALSVFWLDERLQIVSCTNTRWQTSSKHFKKEKSRPWRGHGNISTVRKWSNNLDPKYTDNTKTRLYLGLWALTHFILHQRHREISVIPYPVAYCV